MSHSDNLPRGVILNLGSDEGAILVRLNSTDGNALQVFVTFVNRLSLNTQFVWTTFRVKVVALMCDLHELLVGEPKGVLGGGVFSYTKDDLEGTEMKQSRHLDGLQTKSSLRLDFPLEVLFIYRRET